MIQKVTYSGGSVPTGEDSTFSFLAQPAASKTYTFGVQQTYSDGSVVDWAGAESSDTPAPTRRGEVVARRRQRHLDARDRRADRRCDRARCSASSVSSRAGSAPSHDPTGTHPGADRRAGGGSALPAAAWAHAALLRTVPVASATVNAPPKQVALTYSEAVEPRFAIVSVTDATGTPGDGRARPAGRRRTRHAARAAQADRRRAGTSSTGARSPSTGTRCGARSRSRSGRTPAPRRSSRCRRRRSRRRRRVS